MFILPGYDPTSDTIVQEFSFGSSTMKRLRAAGIRRDIPYHLILTANTTASPAFFPIFNGATWQLSIERGWQMTYSGDGIVTHSDSFLAGVVPEILPVIPDTLIRAPHLNSHINLPKNPEIIARIMHYLNIPKLPS